MPRRTSYKAARLRYLVVARLESAGLADNQIAACTGYSPKTITKLLADPVYREWRNARLSNGISQIDAIISDDDKEMKIALRELVPSAIRTLELGMNSDKEELRIKAATEILDRDQRFNKQQNIAVAHFHTFSQGDLDRARELAKQLKGKDTESPSEHIPLQLPAGDVIEIEPSPSTEAST